MPGAATLTVLHRTALECWRSTFRATATATHPNIYYTVEEVDKHNKSVHGFALGIKKASIAGISTSAVSAVVLGTAALRRRWTS